MENESFRFNLYLSDIGFDCEVAMVLECFRIYFDGDFLAGILPDEYMYWYQVEGKRIPQDLIDFIGRKIQNKYD